jgi:hypothetical protein
MTNTIEGERDKYATHAFFPPNHPCVQDALDRAKIVLVLPIESDEILSLRAQLAEKEKELNELKNGDRAIIPQTQKHAENLYTVAVACLKTFGADPEQAIRKQTGDSLKILSDAIQFALDDDGLVPRATSECRQILREARTAAMISLSTTAEEDRK